METCDKGDPELNECLIASGNKLIDHLRNGVPELRIFEVGLNLMHCQEFSYTVRHRLRIGGAGDN